ncbi:hypothetical protein BSKO_08950 [Bryopsis sp. KO-2023]|nr:hypothetical protein BSKO_08950 [Bryopsis sp. KO-2023]
MAGYGLSRRFSLSGLLLVACWICLKLYVAEGIQFFPNPQCDLLCQNRGARMSLVYLEHCFMGADAWCCGELEKENARLISSCECAFEVSCNLAAFSGPKTFSECGFNLPYC